jgi:hypothetical protein
MPGHRHGPSIKNSRWYEALRRRGMSKRKAARISNAMAKGHPTRSRMARKAARTRNRRGR